MDRTAAKPHYPFLTRVLLDLFREGRLKDVAEVEIEPTYGFVGRVVYNDGRVRLFRGANPGVNNHGAAEISRDKGYSKHFLARLGYRVPEGRVFLLPFYRKQIAERLSRFGFAEYAEARDICGYIRGSFGYPCFLKPNDGSQGTGVWPCAEDADVMDTLREYEAARTGTVLVEESVDLNEYRVVVYRGEMACAYQRSPAAVAGDGTSTLRDLLDEEREKLDARGKSSRSRFDDPRFLRHLDRRGLRLDTVLEPGRTETVGLVANLSAGGRAGDVTTQIDDEWSGLCVRIARDMGLDFCGVDLACPSITRPAETYSVIEINASPGLAHFAALGEGPARRTRDIYRRMFAS